MSILSNYIHSIDPADNIMVVGDFNARTATMSPSINICPYHPEDEDRLYDLVYTRLNEAYNVPQCSVSRSSKDSIVNEQGRQLIDMCSHHNFVILNGLTRVGTQSFSAFEDGYTFSSNRVLPNHTLPSSVIDYVCCNMSCLEEVDSLKICDGYSMSDHLNPSFVDTWPPRGFEWK